MPIAIAGNIVKFAIRQSRELEQLELPELQQFHDGIEADVYDYLTLQGSVAARDHSGGTAPNQVKQAVAGARRYLATLTADDG